MSIDEDGFDEEEQPEKYELTRKDTVLLAAARSLLLKVIRGAKIRPAEIVSVARLLHAVVRLPRVTEGIHVEVRVCGPRRRFGEIETYHWWEVQLEQGNLRLGSGGHFHRPSTGGDTFTTMSWEISPGCASELADHRGSLGIVPDVCSYEEGVGRVDFGSEGFSVDVTDDGNPLLEEMVADEEEGEDTEPNGRDSELDPETLGMAIELVSTYVEQGVTKFSEFASRAREELPEIWDKLKPYLHGAWCTVGDSAGTQVDEVTRKQAAEILGEMDARESTVAEADAAAGDEEGEEDQAEAGTPAEGVTFSVSPADSVEAVLAQVINEAQVMSREPDYAGDIEMCDFCQTQLSHRGLFVDGMTRGDIAWANMCVTCFNARGAGIGWGKGQLYARQPNGHWRLVAGFPPKPREQN